MLISTEHLARVVRATIFTARVKRSDIKPLSIFLIAPFERGKTTLVLQNVSNKTIVATDASGFGLLEAFTLNPEATHVAINDLSAVTGHKQQVTKLTIAILNGLAEEGSYTIALPRMQHLDLKGRKVGVIACCVPKTYRDNRSWWHKSGFASRLLCLEFDHSETLSARILASIASDNGKHDEKICELNVPAAPVYVDIPKQESMQILSLSQVVAKANDEIGYRKQKQFRALACGHALLRGSWKNARVGKVDIEFLERTVPFIVQENGEVVKLK